MKECGRVVEQKDELQKRLDMLQQLIASGSQTPEVCVCCVGVCVCCVGVCVYVRESLCNGVV